MKLPLAAFLLLALVGCSATGSAPHQPDKPTLLPAPASLPASKVATITIYRPDTGYASDSHPTVSVNGSDLVSPHRGTTFKTRLLPGKYHFEVEGEKAGDLRADAGKNYAFQLILVPSGFGSTARLGIVSPEQAKDESAGLQPIDKDDIENPAFR